MEESVWNRKMILAVLTLFVFVFAVQMSEPAAAAKWKKFDKGTKTINDPYYGTFKFKWTAYKKNNNYVKVVLKYSSGKLCNVKYYLKKGGKIKITTVDHSSKFVSYATTSLTAVKYYKKYFKKGLS